MAPQSFFTYILPYIDRGALFATMNQSVFYTDPVNQSAAKTPIASFLCPTNQQTVPDPKGYGLVDYMPVAYNNLPVAAPYYYYSNASSTNNPIFEGALGWGFHPVSYVRDGTSNTIAVLEDSGRLVGNFNGDYSATTPAVVSGVLTQKGQLQIATGAALTDLCAVATFNGVSSTNTGNTCPNRWADSDSANGVSGPPSGSFSVINNNKTFTGNNSACNFMTRNCGPNDEPYSWHDGGCHAVLCDGSVRCISENVDTYVIKAALGPNDGYAPQTDF